MESIASALVRAAEAGHPFVLVSPASLEASFASRPSSTADVLRETFDVFEDGVCLLARDGSLKVANAIGERLFSSVLKADLQGVARDATQRRAIADRSLSLDGRAYVVRAYPLSERGVVLYVRDATDERNARSAGSSRRNWRRSGCSPPVSRTRSTTPPLSCWPTSKL